VLSTLALTLPIFAVVGAGWLAARLGLLTQAHGEGLAKFVFWLAFPSLLASAMIKAPPPSATLWSAMGLYCAAMLVVQACAHLLAWPLRLSPQQRAVAAMTGSCGNTAFIGTSVCLAAFGAEALGVAAALVVVENVLVVGIAVAGLHLAKAGGSHAIGTVERARTALKAVLSGLLNPVSAGALIGLVIALAGWAIPAWALKPFELLGAAASPAGLVALGVTMAGIGLRFDGLLKPSILAIILKCIALPLVVFAVFTAFGINNQTTQIAVVLAACPAAVNCFIQARASDVEPTQAAVSVFLSTLFSILSVTAALALVG
jgi:malonate transporter and related proteins